MVRVVLPLALAAAPSAARENVVVVPAAERPALAASIGIAIARYDSASAFPVPPLDPEQLAALLDGEVVRLREKWALSREGDEERTRQRVLAYRLVGAPRAQVWLAALDPHFPLDDRITEIRMDDTGDGTWYQLMDLPWPVRNRHWVIHVEKGLEVAAATGGQAWEHSWRLDPSGEARVRERAAGGLMAPLEADEVRGARYLDANDGAWAVFRLADDLTLLTYDLTIVLGGWIPEGMAARFAMRTLEDLLDRVAANASRVPAHYVTGHDPIPAGDGTPVPYFTTTPGTP
jgi:hypothetical protein